MHLFFVIETNVFVKILLIKELTVVERHRSMFGGVKVLSQFMLLLADAIFFSGFVRIILVQGPC